MSAPREPVPGIASLRREALAQAISTKALNNTVIGHEQVDSRKVLEIAKDYLAFLTGRLDERSR